MNESDSARFIDGYVCLAAEKISEIDLLKAILTERHLGPHHQNSNKYR